MVSERKSELQQGIQRQESGKNEQTDSIKEDNTVGVGKYYTMYVTQCNVLQQNTNNAFKSGGK